MHPSTLIPFLAVLPVFVSAAVPPFHLSRRAEDAQTSLTLDKSQVQANAAKNGQEAGAEAGQVASLTSTNNFINFCLTQKTDITNGLQTKTGSCNPTIMGRILATDKLPSSKFVFPTNTGVIKAKTDFTIKMQIKNMVTGNFVNPKTNYFSAPCQVDATGTLLGHSHVVIEKLTAIDQTTAMDPNTFAFFKGLNGKADGQGILSADVVGGLDAGVYRLSSINTCANHQPVLGSIAQHGSFDDAIYFSVTADGKAATTAAPAPAAANAAAPVTPAAPAAAAAPAAKPAAGNLQTFTGALGGVAAPAFSATPQGSFDMGGQFFASKTVAKQSSCQAQQAACIPKVSAAACAKQAEECLAAK